MKKAARILTVLMTVILLVSNVALAARLTAGDVARKMAGTYVGIGTGIYYKITPSGDDLKLEGGLTIDDMSMVEIMHDYDVVSVNSDGTKIKFVESALSYLSTLELELLPNGHIMVSQTVDADTDTYEMVMVDIPSTGDTANVMLLVVMMLIAAAGIVVAGKKLAQY